MAIVLSGALGAVLFYRFWVSPKQEQVVREQNGIAERLVIDQTVTENLRWEDISRGKFVIPGGSEAGLANVLKLAESSSNEPMKYLRGLLLLADSQPEAALDAFEEVAIGQIPLTQLYAPFRLHDQLRPDEENRYFRRLFGNIDSTELPPLIRARLHSRAAQFIESLTSYIASDPSDWTAYDADCMQRIGLQSGLESEVQRILLAAIGGGSIPVSVQSRFAELVFRGGTQSIHAQLEHQFRRNVSRDPSIGPMVKSVLKRVGDDRDLFLSQDYDRLVKKYRGSPPIELSSEQNLMLFLSALSERDRSLATKWGQELKRRNPQPETTKWVDNLMSTAFASGS